MRRTTCSGVANSGQAGVSRKRLDDAAPANSPRRVVGLAQIAPVAAPDFGAGVELHYLDVPADELWRRIEVRNSEPPWDSYPIRRADLGGWLRLFQAPDADELALSDLPPTSD